MVPEFWIHLGAAWQWFLVGLEMAALTVGLAHVTLRQRDSRAAAFWAVIIIFVPLLGAAFYSVFGINRLRRTVKKYRSGMESHKTVVGEAVPANPWEKFPEISGLRRLAATST